MGNNKEPAIELRLDQHIVQVVFDTFSYMLENYHITGVIDHAAWIINEKELKAMIADLKPYYGAEIGVRFFSLSAQQYDTFVRLIDYRGFAAPKRVDRALLEDVHEAYFDSEDGKDRIHMILAFDPFVLSTLKTVFQKIIADPGAIDSSMYDLTPWEKFEGLVVKLDELNKSLESLVVVPLTFSEWTTFICYLSHIDDLDEDELATDEKTVMEQIMAWEFSDRVNH